MNRPILPEKHLNKFYVFFFGYSNERNVSERRVLFTCGLVFMFIKNMQSNCWWLLCMARACTIKSRCLLGFPSQWDILTIKCKWSGGKKIPPRKFVSHLCRSAYITCMTGDYSRATGLLTCYYIYNLLVTIFSPFHH